MSKVLVVATSRKTRGGITAVVKAHETGEQWEKFHCHWVQTHRDGPTWRKLVYLAVAMLDFVIRLPFYEIVHIHFSITRSAERKLYFERLARLFGKKIIIHLHCGTQISEIWSPVYDEMFQKADFALMLSQNLMLKVKDYTMACPMDVLYNPCPVISWQDRSDLSSKKILFSGTLYQGKGYADMIRAFAKIAYAYPDWSLVFAGNGEVQEGRTLAHELGINSQVCFLGWVNGEQKTKAFQDASIFCLPSYAEGFPMAVLDAWSYGLPVITTPVGGIPDVAKDGENMLLFSPGDIDALAICMERMISDAELRMRISRASLDFARTTFNVKTINEKLERLYEDMLS